MKQLPSLDFVSAVKLAISRVKEMDGRSRRSEFWWIVLALVIVNFVLAFIPVIGPIASFVLWIATIPLMIRRCHDTGNDGKKLVFTAVGLSVASSVLIMIQTSLAEKAMRNFDMSAASTHDALRIPVILIGLASFLLNYARTVSLVPTSGDHRPSIPRIIISRCMLSRSHHRCRNKCDDNNIYKAAIN